MRVLLAIVMAFVASHAWAQSYPPQVAEKVRESLSCPAGRGANVADFVLQGDFNGDGVNDYVFDENASPCPDFIMCGSAGCYSSAFLSSGGGFSSVDLGNVHDLKVVRSRPRDQLRAGLHGGMCGQSGAASCERLLEWNGQRFATATASTPPRAPAPSGAAWRVEHRGAPWVATAKAQAGGWSIDIECLNRRTIEVTLILNPLGAWNGGLPVILKIDQRPWPVTTEGVGDYGVITHETEAFAGMSQRFISALKSGGSLVLDGPAAARVPLANRTFSLAGATAALNAAGISNCSGAP